KLQMPVPWEEPIESLSVGIQQRIEILKLLYNNAELLILDEPTAVLTPQEVDVLCQQLLNLKAKGKTIILITHKLSEVRALADDVTVFRQGEVVGTYKAKQKTSDELAQLMIGRPLENCNRER